MAKPAVQYDDDEILTPRDFERIYKVKEATQASWRSRGKIPYFLVGERIPRYRRSEVEAHFARLTELARGGVR